jgi:uncharacterized protein (TIGR02001 family)
MKLTQGLAAIVLVATAATAHAEVTGTVTATTDYDFRGITQTSQDPALQGSIDYAHDSGFYAGVWGSNVDFGDCCDENIEIDLYAGFSGGEEFVWDVGYVYYTYPGADEYPGASDIDYGEFFGELGWKMLSGKIWYSPSFFESSADAWYYEANANFELPANFGLGLHAGYSDGDYWGDNNYVDWSVGVTYTISHFNLGLKWVDGSDYEPGNNTHDDVNSSDARAIFSVSTTFPWSQE